MAHNLPYLTSQKRLNEVFKKIKSASTPDNFNASFLDKTFDMRGGTAQSVPPLLKRVGFLNSDGTPSDWYKQFRNPALSGAVAFQALKKGYADLYTINEVCHKLSDANLKGVIAQVTGLDHDNVVITYILATFKTIRSFAKFEEVPEQAVEPIVQTSQESNEDDIHHQKNSYSPEKQGIGMNIGYTINLNLPATTDIAVFDAIFKSLKEHLLEE